MRVTNITLEALIKLHLLILEESVEIILTKMIT